MYVQTIINVESEIPVGVTGNCHGVSWLVAMDYYCYTKALLVISKTHEKCTLLYSSYSGYFYSRSSTIA